MAGIRVGQLNGSWAYVVGTGSKPRSGCFVLSVAENIRGPGTTPGKVTGQFYDVSGTKQLGEIDGSWNYNEEKITFTITGQGSGVHGGSTYDAYAVIFEGVSYLIGSCRAATPPLASVPFLAKHSNTIG